jgi:hypothetical protein
MEFIINISGQDYKAKLYLGGTRSDIVAINFYRRDKFLWFNSWTSLSDVSGVYSVIGADKTASWDESMFLKWATGKLNDVLECRFDGINNFKNLSEKNEKRQRQ